MQSDLTRNSGRRSAARSVTVSGDQRRYEVVATPTKPETSRRPAAGVPRLALSIDGAATALGLSPRLIDELARSGEIPSFRVGRRRLFSVQALRRWVEAQAADTPNQGG